MTSLTRRAVPAGAMAVALASPALADDTVRIGLIAPFSGAGAIWGTSWKQAIEVFQKQNGDKVAGKKVEIVMRDLPGVDPLKARALAQELVVKEHVQYLAGIVYSPNALALGAFAEQAHVPIVIFNAATSSILDKSDYFLRTAFTEAQLFVPAAVYAQQQGHKNVVTVVTDYAPGWDVEKSFSSVFEKNGGKIVGKIRIPLSTSDYGPYLQRAKTMGAQTIVGFVPGGGPAFALLTAYNNSGLSQAGVTYLGSDETLEQDLHGYGDTVLGVHTFFYWSAAHRSKENEAFLKLMHDNFPSVTVNSNHVCAWDGMYAIYKMIEATKGEKDGPKAIAAARGLKWESPRGPVEIDPKTRDFLQNVYLRVVEKDAKGQLYNKEILAYPMQPDYGRAGHPIPTAATLKPIKLD
jgi:branched-chain amino acid transport system substrate-binding protein